MEVVISKAGAAARGRSVGRFGGVRAAVLPDLGMPNLPSMLPIPTIVSRCT
jgi:hypothetical protein